jgi:hypothetical protein
MTGNTYYQDVKSVILTLKDRTGTSRQAITKQVEKIRGDAFNLAALRKALKDAVENGKLVQDKGSYKLSADEKKKPKKPKKKSKSPSPKKPKALKIKTTTPKKKVPAAKKGSPAGVEELVDAVDTAGVEELVDVVDTAGDDDRLIVLVAMHGPKLRVTAPNSEHPDWFLRFPKPLRIEGARYRVAALNLGKGNSWIGIKPHVRVD